MLTVPQDYRLPEPLKLDCGKELKEVNVRYETAGTLNEAGTNAILIDHALTGDAHVCGKHTPEDKKPGWWDTMIGPGKGIDTDKYFVICSNVLGGCSGTTGPLSIDPDTGKPYNLNFPVITVADMVRAQKALIDHLGIKKMLAVVGGSMGGMQVLEWAVAHPEMMKCVIPIATTTRMSAQGIAFDWIGREAIQSDPEWHNGEYRQKGLRGKVPGVEIVGTSIRIRGINTTGNTDALIILDGMEVSDISDINPSDVKSVEVLKDAASTIYGMRGANGVVIIKTKGAKDD